MLVFGGSGGRCRKPVDRMREPRAPSGTSSGSSPRGVLDRRLGRQHGHRGRVRPVLGYLMGRPDHQPAAGRRRRTGRNVAADSRQRDGVGEPQVSGYGHREYRRIHQRRRRAASRHLLSRRHQPRSAGRASAPPRQPPHGASSGRGECRQDTYSQGTFTARRYSSHAVPKVFANAASSAGLYIRCAAYSTTPITTPNQVLRRKPIQGTHQQGSSRVERVLHHRVRPRRDQFTAWHPRQDQHDRPCPDHHAGNQNNDRGHAQRRRWTADLEPRRVSHIRDQADDQERQGERPIRSPLPTSTFRFVLAARTSVCRLT